MRVTLHVLSLLSLVMVCGCVVMAPNQPCMVTSVPSGASIAVNGRDVGTTPCEVDYPGHGFIERYEFKASMEGYSPATRTTNGWPSSVRLNLTRILSQDTQPAGPSPSDCDLTLLPQCKDLVSVAVLDFLSEGDLAKGTGESLADFCRQAVQRSGRFVLVDRAAIKALLSEEDFAAVVKCDETRCLVNYGKKLRAQKLVHGRIARLGESYILTLKMIDIGSGAVNAIETTRIKGNIELTVDFVEPATCRLIRQTATTRPNAP